MTLQVLLFKSVLDAICKMDVRTRALDVEMQYTLQENSLDREKYPVLLRMKATWVDFGKNTSLMGFRQAIGVSVC